MNEKLRTCPFCGGIKSVHEVRESTDNYEIVCDVHLGGCGAASGWRKTVDEAIDAWNRRTE
jgi:Lar family restriction alleviation protein